jgi:hypothetical protein
LQQRYAIGGGEPQSNSHVVDRPGTSSSIGGTIKAP